VGFFAGMAVGAAESNWWGGWWGGNGPYWGGGGWWGASGYRNININNIHNNVVNWQGGRAGGQRFVRPVAGPANRPNLYNRSGNQANLASRRQATRPAGEVQPARTGSAAQARTGQARPGQARPGQNNVFAGKNGDVYRKTPQGWQERQGNNWSRPNAGAAARPPVDMTRRGQGAPSRPATQPNSNIGQLNQEFNARQRGETRTQNFQRAQSAPAYRPSAPSRPSGGGVSRPSGGAVSRPSGGAVSRPSGGGGGGGGGSRGGGGGGGGGGRKR
jgi:hypothetical protein